jgi:rhodanese-related sulfurtransferase
MKRVSPEQAGAHQGRLIDVRGLDEFAAERLAKAVCVPLDQLPAAASAWNRSESLVVMCRSGMRSAKAAEILESMGFTGVLMLEGGIEACKKSGVEILRDRKSIPLFRQVMIVAGALLMAGLVLARLNPWFILVDWFVAGGLVLGGLTGCCPMAVLLAKMPWNAVSGCSSGACTPAK